MPSEKERSDDADAQPDEQRMPARFDLPRSRAQGQATLMWRRLTAWLASDRTWRWQTFASDHRLRLQD